MTPINHKKVNRLIAELHSIVKGDTRTVKEEVPEIKGVSRCDAQNCIDMLFQGVKPDGKLHDEYLAYMMQAQLTSVSPHIQVKQSSYLNAARLYIQSLETANEEEAGELESQAVDALCRDVFGWENEND